MARIVAKKKTFLSKPWKACEKPGSGYGEFFFLLLCLLIASEVRVIPDLLTLSRASASGGKFYLQQRSVAGNGPKSQTVAPRPNGWPSPDGNHKTELVRLLGARRGVIW